MQHRFIIRHVSKTKSKNFANNNELFSFYKGFDSVERIISDRLSAKFMKKIDMPLLLIARNMEHGPEIKTRTFRKEILKNCFFGDAAVEWMINSPNCPVSNAEEAIILGNKFKLDGLIQHGSQNYPKPFLNEKQPYQ